MSLLRYKVIDVDSNMFNDTVVISREDDGFVVTNTMSGKVGHFTMDQLECLTKIENGSIKTNG